MSSISVGAAHVCALTPEGALKCWGWNTSGQLGDGTTTDKSTPVPVSGLSSGVSAVSGSPFFTCAITSIGGVKCWGLNTYGNLGDGTTTSRLTPVDVVGLGSEVVALSTVQNHACALTSGGGVKCWGENAYGQLGDDTTTSPRTTPVDVTGLASGVSDISVGQYHTCVVTTAGGVKCWGYNFYGQLGDGTTSSPRLTPVDVVGLTSGVTRVFAGANHTCALLATGGLKCWGQNTYGKLGDGTTTSPRVTPVDVVGLGSGVQAASLGSDQTCALTSAGSIQCWGRNHLGQLGEGSNTDRLAPANVVGLNSGVRAISVKSLTACALTVVGSLKCWGANSNSQLGDGTTTHRNRPVNVIGIGGWVNAITSSAVHTCALTSAGGVKCWGGNLYGQLGDGSNIERQSPVDVVGLSSGVIAIAAGDFHTCAITDAGQTKCWGSNWAGQLGNGLNTDSNMPVNASLLDSVTLIAAGGNHTCSVNNTGIVSCWGYNQFGQLGNASNTNASTPVGVSGLSHGSGIVNLSLGSEHTCALSAQGGVKCWGRNLRGQLGNGTNTSSNVPVDVSGLTSGVSGIAAGQQHTCAISMGGWVKCWGYNNSGQLGDATLTDRNTQRNAIGLSIGGRWIAAMGDHSCAVLNGGLLKCWGKNNHSQLGDGSNTTRSAPANVLGLGGPANAVSGGHFHTCALRSNGFMLCWGQNTSGQLGDGSTTSRNSPVNVLGLPWFVFTPLLMR